MTLGSLANKIAKYFITKTAVRATPAIMKKTHAQAKILLQNNYTFDEIISVIDYIIDKQKTKMYSLGYVNTCINTILFKIEKKELKTQTLQNKNTINTKITEYAQQNRCEVTADAKSSERNQAKIKRLGIQSRFGKESFGDLFERN